MADLRGVLSQFTARYRAALLTKVGVLGALGVAVLGAAAWRLQGLRVPSLWSVGVPMLLAAAVVVSLGWWVRRRWLSAHTGAAYLDQCFGLQQRLVTAEEFASTAHPSPLYPLLVEDAVRRCKTAQAHVPKPLTSTSGVLALALLLLLLWPHGGRAPMRLAQQPISPSPLPPPPNDTPPTTTPPPSESPQQQRSTSPQSAPSGQGQQSTASGGGSNQQQPKPSGGSSGQSSGQSKGEGRQGQGAQGGAQGAQPPRAQSGGQQSGGQKSESSSSAGEGARQRAQRQGAAEGDTHEAGEHRQAGGTEQGQPSSGASSHEQAERGSPQGAKQGTQQGAQPGGASSRGAEGRRSGGNALSAGSGLPAAAQAGQSPGDQEALKGEIQQLLKEVSGELKQLQAQLDTAKSPSQPDAGTGTDPQLYDAASSQPALGPSGRTPLAVQLQTDTGEVKASRPGSGVGRASATAAGDAPQTAAETAQLSETPREESASVRQTVPPEYVGVFDRLHRQRTPPQQPSEAK